MRECNNEQYLLDFAYDPQNYAWYNKHQNVYLSHLKETEHQVFQDLKTIGIGGNIIGVRFSAIHGDLITELLMEKTKGPAGSNRFGFGTDK